jgi:hypothetical protein
LFGRIGSLPKPLRLPRTSARARAAAPGVDVDRRPAGEVDGAQAGADPPALVEVLALEGEDPVRDREVHDGDPDAGEDHPRAELRAVGHGAGDEGDGDDGEGRLEADEGHRGVRADGDLLADQLLLPGHQAVEAEVLDRVADQPADGVAEGEGVAVEHPQDADEAECPEAHHHHVEDPAVAVHAAVEHREAWGHQQHQRGAGQDPGGRARVHHVVVTFRVAGRPGKGAGPVNERNGDVGVFR